MMSLKLCVVLFVSVASARMLRRPQTKKVNIGKVLVGVERKIKAGLAASMSSMEPPDFANDIFGCALTIKQGMSDLRLSYTEVQVPVIIQQACDFSNVYLELGKSKDECRVLLKALEDEVKGDQNYHRWCRKVAAAESEAMKKALDKIKNDAEAKKLLGECEKECPFVSKIIEHGAAFQELLLELMKPPPAGTSFADFMKMLLEKVKKMMTQANAACDQSVKMKCTLQNMHGSCGKMFDKIGLPIAHVEEHINSACKTVEPCKKVCNGVVEKVTDFQVKRTMSMFTGAPSADEAMDLCKSYDRTQECKKHAQCDDYFSYFAHDTEHIGEKCKVVMDPCFAKVNKECSKEAEKFFGTEGDGKNAWDQITCTDKFYPWMESTREEVKKCCTDFGSLAMCAKKQKCEHNLKSYMYVTPDARWPEGEIVECACKPEWSKGFGEQACQKNTYSRDDPDVFGGSSPAEPEPKEM